MHTHILCVSLLFVIFLGAGVVSRSTTNNATEISVPSVDDKWEYFLLLLLLGLGGKNKIKEKKGENNNCSRLSRVYRLKVAASSSIVFLACFYLLVKSSSVGKCVQIISWRLYVRVLGSILSLTDYTHPDDVYSSNPGAILAWPLFPLSLVAPVALSSAPAKESERIGATWETIYTAIY